MMTLREYLHQNYAYLLSNANPLVIVDARIYKHTILYDAYKKQIGVVSLDYPIAKFKTSLSSNEFELIFLCKLIPQSDYFELVFVDDAQPKQIICYVTKDYLEADFGIKLVDIKSNSITNPNLLSPKEIKDRFPDIKQIDLIEEKIDGKSFQEFSSETGIIIRKFINRLSPIQTLIKEIPFSKENLLIDNEKAIVSYEDCEIIYKLPDNYTILLYDFGIAIQDMQIMISQLQNIKESNSTEIRSIYEYKTNLSILFLLASLISSYSDYFRLFIQTFLFQYFGKDRYAIDGNLSKIKDQLISYATNLTPKRYVDKNFWIQYTQSSIITIYKQILTSSIILSNVTTDPIKLLRGGILENEAGFDSCFEISQK